MTTPVVDFVKKYIESKSTRLHMPGHKGKSLLGFEAYDITEFDGADVLYHAEGILRESMENATALFGSGKTVYSAEGSSLSIRAMLYLAVLYARSKGERAHILAGRNAHKVFVMSASLLDFDISWLYGEADGGITQCVVSPTALDRCISEMAEKPTAVYITSPDYLGSVADIEGISKVCKRHGVLLLVDNAHGAYLNFLPENRHPMHLGADICCDSAHKTLPAITGAGYLHISQNAPDIILHNAYKAMSLFASTSPSYLILQSLDILNKYLSENYRERLSEYCLAVKKLKKRLCDFGIANLDGEPLKITITPKKFGYTGVELAEYLSEKGMVCEFYDPDYVVLMLTPENGVDVLDKIYNALSCIPKKTEITEKPPKFASPRVKLSVREAIYGETEKIPVKDSLGRVFAGFNVACPPAIPIAVCGEIIDKDVIALMEYYGEQSCEVLKFQI